jgi:peroxiredoxin
MPCDTVRGPRRRVVEARVSMTLIRTESNMTRRLTGPRALVAVAVIGIGGVCLSAAGTRVALQPISARKAAPDFALQDAAGRDVNLSGYRGQVVLLDFWATACGGCVQEIPAFMELARTYEKKGLRTVGLSVDLQYESLKNADEAWSKVKPFIKEHKVNYQIVMGDDQVLERYAITALPCTYLIDKSGRVAATYVGIVDRENVEGNIQLLLKE